MKKLFFIWAAIILAAIIGIVTGSALLAVGLLAAFALVIASPKVGESGFCRLTLSVPELSQMVIDAFKFQTPELFGPNGFALDVSSQTARLNDKITSHIVSVPTTSAYDPNTGFEDASLQDSTDLLTDVPVTLSQSLKTVIRIKLGSQLSSKINLAQSMAEQGYALRKAVIDAVLAQVTSGNFSHQKAVDTASVNLDAAEGIRTKLNKQKALPFGRFGIVNSDVAGALQGDQRIGSSLFYQQLNGDQGYRTFKRVSGFNNIFEYPDFPTAGNITGFFGDRRSLVVAVRALDFAQVKASDLGIPENMAIFPMQDPATGLPFTAAGYQKYGTGDIIFALAILFGVGAGNQGGAGDTITDRAGVRLVSSGSDA